MSESGEEGGAGELRGGGGGRGEEETGRRGGRGRGGVRRGGVRGGLTVLHIFMLNMCVWLLLFRRQSAVDVLPPGDGLRHVVLR